jgi:hypothetical protein
MEVRIVVPFTRLAASFALVSAIAVGGCSKDSPASPTSPSTPTCTFTVGSAPSDPLAAAASEFSVAITTAASCSWTATSSAPFISTVGASSGTGNGTVRFAVQANTGAARQGTVLVAGTTLTVQQSAGAPPTCDYKVTPTSASVAQTGGDVSIDVSAAAGCSWTVTTPDAFVSVKQGASGSGSGTVILSVAANSGAGRSGTANVAGATVTISQDGTTSPPPPPPACAFNVSPTQISANAAASTSTISITVTQGTNCSWTAQSQSAFITVTGSSAGVGNGSVTILIASNAGAARTGTLTVAGHTVSVGQSAGTAGMVAVVSYTSDPGDIVGRGQSNSYTLQESQFGVALDPSQSEFSFNTSFGSNSWLNIILEVPVGQKLAPGLYEHAEGWPFQAAGRPGLSVSANSNGCNQVTGRFLIAEAVYAGNLIQRLHARIEHHCEGSSPAFRAEIWIDAQGSTTPPPMAQFPPAPPVPTTLLAFHSDPGYPGGGYALSYSLATATFSGWGGVNGNSVRIGAGSLISANGWWQLILAAPTGAPLQVGTYNNTARFPSATQPRFDFFGTDYYAFSCNESTGSFVVQELVYGPQGELERFHATFAIKCTGATAGLSGEVYIVADPWR